MKNTKNFELINSELLSTIELIDQLSMEAVIGIDHLANRSQDPGDLIFFNELASSLELMQSQLDYYLPVEDGVVDLDEWVDLLAVFNAGADWIGDQVVEIESRFGSSVLSDCLHELSLSYVEAIPLVVAARLAQEDGEVALSAKRLIDSGSLVGILSAH